MTPAVTFQPIAWDAAKAYPNGVDSLKDGPSEALQQFFEQIARAITEGGEIIATLPLAQAGQAILLVAQVDEPD